MTILERKNSVERNISTMDSSLSISPKAATWGKFKERAKGLTKLSALHHGQQPQVNCSMLTVTDPVVSTLRRNNRVAEPAGSKLSWLLKSLWLCFHVEHIGKYVLTEK